MQKRIHEWIFFTLVSIQCEPHTTRNKKRTNERKKTIFMEFTPFHVDNKYFQHKFCCVKLILFVLSFPFLFSLLFAFGLTVISSFFRLFAAAHGRGTAASFNSFSSHEIIFIFVDFASEWSESVEARWKAVFFFVVYHKIYIIIIMGTCVGVNCVYLWAWLWQRRVCVWRRRRWCCCVMAISVMRSLAVCKWVQRAIPKPPSTGSLFKIHIYFIACDLFKLRFNYPPFVCACSHAITSLQNENYQFRRWAETTEHYVV